jgi:AAA domain
MPYENISGLVDLDANQKYKIAIVGEPKTGKSWLAMSAPGKVFVYDFDSRAASIKEYIRVSKRETEIDAKTYWDIEPSMPTAVSQLEADIAMFEYLKQQGKAIPEWFVLDSITFLRAACEHELIKQHPGMSRTIKLGAKNIKIPQGWDIVNGNKAYLEYIIGRLSELGNVIAIFHELDETDKQRSTKDEKKYTGRKTIQPQYLSSLLSIFNDIFRVTIDYSGKRVVQVQPTTDFLASTSMSALATEEVADIAAMIAKQQKASV